MAIDKNYLSFGIIKKGSKGRDVLFAQHMLYVFMMSFCYDLEEDGVFGSETERCVKEFQRRSGLKQDGIIGTDTWRRLGPTLSPSYNFWNKTAAIKYLQGLIYNRYRGEIDGVYGYGTENAVRSFQNAYNLTEDGIWGHQCWSVHEQGYA